MARKKLTMTASTTIEQQTRHRGTWIYQRPDYSYSLYRYCCSTDGMTRTYEDTVGIPYKTIDAALIAGQEWLDQEEPPT